MRVHFFLSFSLVAVLLAACAPAENTTSTNPPATATQPPAAFAPTNTAAPTLEAPTQTASSEPMALPIATSRGPNLEATDPSTVSLASGGLQLVEFFRFT